MTNFQKVVDFNTAFGMDISSTPRPNLYDTNPKNVALALALIEEEVGELKEAIQTKDFTETRDALADILYVVYGAAARFGINADTDFDIVHRSNMSKLCDTEEIAQQTVAKYQADYQAGNSPYDSPYYEFIGGTINKWIVKNKSTGKALKSIHYTKVKFD